MAARVKRERGKHLKKISIAGVGVRDWICFTVKRHDREYRVKAFDPILLLYCSIDFRIFCIDSCYADSNPELADAQGF